MQPHERLERAHARIRQRDHARRQAHAVQKQLDEAWQRLDEWAEQVEAAEERLENLDGLSLTGLFARLLGDRREKTDATREALLRAKLRRDTAQKEVDPLQARLATLAAEVESLDDADRELEAARDAMEAHLLAQGGEPARRLLETAERIGTIEATLREVDEAVTAGFAARRSLDAALHALGSARSWGQYDMIGGGLIATSIKHSRLDGAQGHIGRAQRHLRRFVDELRDVGIDGGGLQVRIQGFARFADYFFDGLIADWSVQSRIVGAQGRVRSTRRQLGELVHELERRRTDLTAELGALRDERARWIEGR